MFNQFNIQIFFNPFGNNFSNSTSTNYHYVVDFNFCLPPQFHHLIHALGFGNHVNHVIFHETGFACRQKSIHPTMNSNGTKIKMVVLGSNIIQGFSKNRSSLLNSDQKNRKLSVRKIINFCSGRLLQ